MTNRFESEKATMIAAWRLVTAGLGVESGKCACAVCGDSPHPKAKTRKQFVPAHFPYPELINPDVDAVCAGCVKIFGGKPSKSNPPLRMRHIIVLKDGTVELRKKAAELYDYLMDPAGIQVFSWATTMKKHHLVFARPCSGSTLMIGSDEQTLTYGPGERNLMPVIAEMLEGFGSETIIDGTYSSNGIRDFGANRWAELEQKISHLRGAQPELLRLLTYATPNPYRSKIQRKEEPMKPEDRAASELLGEIAFASKMRRESGLQFWGGFFARRIRRFGRKDLPTLVSKLMEECIVPASQSQGVTGALEMIEGDSLTQQVETAIRERADLLAALAFDHVQQRRKDK